MTPIEFFAGWAEAALGVLPWMVAAAVAAVGLYFGIFGIRKGLEFFISIIKERRNFMGTGMSEKALVEYYKTDRSGE